MLYLLMPSISLFVIVMLGESTLCKDFTCQYSGEQIQSFYRYCDELVNGKPLIYMNKDIYK